MLIDCPCGNMYASRDHTHCPKCDRKACLAYTDEANDHWPEPDGDEDGYEEEDRG